MIFKPKDGEVAKNEMYRKNNGHSAVSCQVFAGFRIFLVEVDPSPHAARRAAMERGICSHLSRVLIVALGFPIRKRGKMV